MGGGGDGHHPPDRGRAAASAGTRFALTRNERSGTSGVGTLAALALVVAGVVGAIAFATSLGRLVADRARFGDNYTVGIGDISDLAAIQLRAAYEGDKDVDGLMILSGGQARAGDTSIGLIGVERVQGDLAPVVLAGRLPAGPDELALGRVAARQLHLHLGDDVVLEGSAGRRTYRVVGLAVVPGLGGNDGIGQGGVVTSDGLARLEPNPGIAMAAMTVRPDAPPGAAQRLAARVQLEAGPPSVPSAIRNVARVRRIPALLAVLLASLALLTMTHALIVSVQSRRRDLAVLRALGANGGWIARAVHWQATVLGAVPLLVGVPLGLIAGSVVFRAFRRSHRCSA